MTLLLLILMALTPNQHILLQKHLEQNTKADLTEGLFDKQAGVYASKAKRKEMTCGRRGGKTTTLSRLGHESLQDNPAEGGDESITPFIGPTKNHAKRLIWGRMQLDARYFKIPMEFNNTELIATHQNGAQFWVMGADDDRDVQRLRGFSFRRVIVDEAQAVGADFEDLVDEVLDPALADWDGDLVLSGTPNAACVGYFYRAATGQLKDDDGRDQWAHWKWTVRDNPMFPKWRGHKNWRKEARQWLTMYRRKKGWAEDHPSYLREWEAMWSKDEGGLVVHYNKDKNHFKGLQKGYHWQHVLGIDLGRGTKPKTVKGVPKGNFALHVWAFCDDLPDLFSVYQYKRFGLEVSDWADKIKEVQAKYKPLASVVDTGALGAVIATDISQRFGIPLEPAEKKEKNAAIDILNSELAAKRVWVPEGSDLAKEWEILQWDEDRKKEDPRFPNDLSDAALYGFRKARHWLFKPSEVLPSLGTDDHSKQVADRMYQQRLKSQKKKQRRRKYR